MISFALETTPIEVLTDGGSRAGLLVLAEGKLAAVLIKIGSEETGTTDSPGGWFMEAGFGPCGSIVARQPDVFASEAQALAWVGERLRHPLP